MAYFNGFTGESGESEREEMQDYLQKGETPFFEGLFLRDLGRASMKHLERESLTFERNT